MTTAPVDQCVCALSFPAFIDREKEYAPIHFVPCSFFFLVIISWSVYAITVTVLVVTTTTTTAIVTYSGCVSTHFSWFPFVGVRGYTSCTLEIVLVLSPVQSDTHIRVARERAQLRRYRLVAPR